MNWYILLGLDSSIDQTLETFNDAELEMASRIDDARIIGLPNLDQWQLANVPSDFQKGSGNRFPDTLIITDQGAFLTDFTRVTEVDEDGYYTLRSFQGKVRGKLRQVSPETRNLQVGNVTDASQYVRVAVVELPTDLELGPGNPVTTENVFNGISPSQIASWGDRYDGTVFVIVQGDTVTAYQFSAGQGLINVDTPFSVGSTNTPYTLDP